MKITEIQLQQLKNLNDSRVNEILGLKLEVGKWYKGNVDFKSLIYITKIGQKQDHTRISYYGFYECKFEHDVFANKDHEKSLVLATHEEVENALIKEAKRRGYENGNYKCLSVPSSSENIEDNYFYENNVLWHGVYDLANTIFKDGKWAEIIDDKSDIKEEIKAIEERLKELRYKL